MQHPSTSPAIPIAMEAIAMLCERFSMYEGLGAGGILGALYSL